MSKRGGGGFLGSVLFNVVNVVVRECLVQAGLKEAHRGGARIKTARRLVQGKDRYGRKKND